MLILDVGAVAVVLDGAGGRAEGRADVDVEMGGDKVVDILVAHQGAAAGVAVYQEAAIQQARLQHVGLRVVVVPEGAQRGLVAGEQVVQVFEAGVGGGAVGEGLAADGAVVEDGRQQEHAEEEALLGGEGALGEHMEGGDGIQEDARAGAAGQGADEIDGQAGQVLEAAASPGAGQGIEAQVEYLVNGLAQGGELIGREVVVGESPDEPVAARSLARAEIGAADEQLAGLFSGQPGEHRGIGLVVGIEMDGTAAQGQETIQGQLGVVAGRAFGQVRVHADELDVQVGRALGLQGALEALGDLAPGPPQSDDDGRIYVDFR